MTKTTKKGKKIDETKPVETPRNETQVRVIVSWLTVPKNLGLHSNYSEKELREEVHSRLGLMAEFMTVKFQNVPVPTHWKPVKLKNLKKGFVCLSWNDGNCLNGTNVKLVNDYDSETKSVLVAEYGDSVEDWDSYADEHAWIADPKTLYTI